jgi:capsular polysaccharide export protein
MTAPRQFLFLQGLPGGFFRDLADALAAQGHRVHRVNFNGGDLVGWRFGGVNYRGGAHRWPAFLARLIMAQQITDVVLFGDCRPLHRMARATAAGLGVVVHVFEEGYLRPDWITLERGGVNGFSPLPDDPQWYREAAAALPPVPARPALPEAFRRRARDTVAYYAAAILLGWAFPLGRTHRPWPPWLEAAGWIGRLAGRRTAQARSSAESARLAETPYFVLPLQLDSDYQLRTHSDFDGMQPALARVLASFARHAPPETLLVVKEHPLDNGLSAWRGRTLDYARALGVADRVVFLEVGDIGVLVRAAHGVVTVNSTTGALALAAGVPVCTLGRAVYDMAGLTHQGALDGFWTAPQPPAPDLYDAFQRVLAHACLLHGGFYDLAGRDALVATAVARILTPQPAEPFLVQPSTALEPAAPEPARPRLFGGKGRGRRIVNGALTWPSPPVVAPLSEPLARGPASILK